MKTKKETITQKARHLAARFYIKNLDVTTQEWIDSPRPDINLDEDIDKDIRDMAELLVKFHQECKQEGL